MRIAVIGAGSIGKRHLTNLRALGHQGIVIDSSLKALKWARSKGIEARHAAAHDALLGVDAALIATPASSHMEWLMLCRNHALPVLVEKPLGILADLPALCAFKPTAPMMVGYQLRFHPDIRRIQPLLSRAAAGILQCRCDSRTWPGSAGRGEFLSEFSHELDLALHCGASPDVKIAEWMDNHHDWYIEVGSFAVTLADRFDGYLRHWEWFDQPRGSYDVLYTSSEQYDRDAAVMYRDELAHFLRAVEGGPIAPGCTLKEGIAVLEVVRQVKDVETVTR